MAGRKTAQPQSSTPIRTNGDDIEDLVSAADDAAIDCHRPIRDFKPKKRGPDHRAPVILYAMAVSDLYVSPR